MEYVYTGKKHYITDAEGNVKLLRGGEVVELTSEQALNFRDKFRPVQSAPEVVVEQDENNDPPADEPVTPVETTE